jgi:deaminated glutathione amidase
MVPVMRVAVAQFSVSGDKSENQTRMSRLAEEAARAGTRLAVFPERAMVDLGASGGDLHGSAEPLDGPFVESLARLPERLGADPSDAPRLVDETSAASGSMR